jgi:hypothetical protein
MKTLKKLGIFMDHSAANLLEFPMNSLKAKSIESRFTHQEKVESLARSESLMHTKEQQLQSEYYKKLGDVILDYEEIVLFGPTDAKVELFNILSDDARFVKIKIEIKQTDKMSENQQYTFVNDYFSKF